MKTPHIPIYFAVATLAALGLLIGLPAIELIPDGPVYLAAVMIGLAVVAYLRWNRPAMRKLTRWAKGSPFKAQLLIAICLWGLAGIGLFNGYNLDRLGYQMSPYTPYVFSVIMAICFALVPFLPRHDRMAMPRVVYRHRLAYLGIAISTLVMAAYIGNRLQTRFPQAVATKIVNGVDRALFPFPTDMAFEGGVPEASMVALKETPEAQARESLSKTQLRQARKAERQARKAEKKANRKSRREARREFRKAFREAGSAGGCVAAVILIILLIGTTCAGICLVFSGSVGGIIGGPLIAAGSIYAMIKVAKWCKGIGKGSASP